MIYKLIGIELSELEFSVLDRISHCDDPNSLEFTQDEISAIWCLVDKGLFNPFLGFRSSSKVKLPKDPLTYNGKIFCDEWRQEHERELAAKKRHEEFQKELAKQRENFDRELHEQRVNFDRQLADEVDARDKAISNAQNKTLVYATILTLALNALFELSRHVHF